MIPQSLVEEFRELGVHVVLSSGTLRYLAERDVVTRQLRERLAAARDDLVRELSGLGRVPRPPASTPTIVPARERWQAQVRERLLGVARELGVEIDVEWLEDRLEAIEERAAIAEFDAGLPRAEAEARALGAVVAGVEAQCDHERVTFEAICDFGGPRGPHDPPVRGCYCCGNRDFVRVRGGPMWFCPRCRPPLPGAEVVERMTAPEPSGREVRRDA